MNKILFLAFLLSWTLVQGQEAEEEGSGDVEAPAEEESSGKC